MKRCDSNTNNASKKNIFLHEKLKFENWIAKMSIKKIYFE